MLHYIDNKIRTYALKLGSSFFLFILTTDYSCTFIRFLKYIVAYTKVCFIH